MKMNMFNNDLLITRLISLRKKHNLSQSAFGNIISISKQGVNEIEKGRAKISVEKLFNIALYFDISLDYLVGLTDNPKTNK